MNLVEKYIYVLIIFVFKLIIFWIDTLIIIYIRISLDYNVKELLLYIGSFGL